jgi:hypothetical protein
MEEEESTTITREEEKEIIFLNKCQIIKLHSLLFLNADRKKIINDISDSQ